MKSGIVPRNRNIKPTFIYWLIDMRPQTISSGHSVGYPFYCGKTVKNPMARLRSHFSVARFEPLRKLSVRLTQCGRQYIRVQTMETVSCTDDWRERERHWIRLLRFSFPDNLNISDGGEGTPGVLMNAERRAAISAFHSGKVTPMETRVLMSEVQKGRRLTSEHREKLKEAWKIRRTRPDARLGRKLSAETRKKISIAHTGMRATDEARAAMSLAQKSRRTRSTHFDR